ncbi:MAG: hypothetical protein HKL95_10550 [Phycisphaerae bacterium]|nr:hypothetical protein [Phycisphaerae bacterium]
MAQIRPWRLGGAWKIGAALALLAAFHRRNAGIAEVVWTQVQRSRRLRSAVVAVF